VPYAFGEAISDRNGAIPFVHFRYTPHDPGKSQLAQSALTRFLDDRIEGTSLVISTLRVSMLRNRKRKKPVKFCWTSYKRQPQHKVALEELEMLK
jgi:hypothetical protein